MKLPIFHVLFLDLNMQMLDTVGGRSQTLSGSPFRSALGPFVCLGGSCRVELLLLGIFFVLSRLSGEDLLRRPQHCHCLCLILVVSVRLVVLGFLV